MARRRKGLRGHVSKPSSQEVGEDLSDVTKLARAPGGIFDISQQISEPGYFALDSQKWQTIGRWDSAVDDDMIDALRHAIEAITSRGMERLNTMVVGPNTAAALQRHRFTPMYFFGQDNIEAILPTPPILGVRGARATITFLDEEIKIQERRTRHRREQE